MKIAYLGTGTWGFCLATLLGRKGYTVHSWTSQPALAETLNRTREHPLLKGEKAPLTVSFTTDMAAALEGASYIAESVTSEGFREVLGKMKRITTPKVPFIITSKGIEQGSGLILPEVALDLFGPAIKPYIAILSGPSYAAEVIQNKPASVAAAAYRRKITEEVAALFTTDNFLVYPNLDIKGVAYGGALKNIIAIACGVADGLGLGTSAQAALMTRGLHEIRKLAHARGCKYSTLNGLSGMGDLWVTCSSPLSRNYRLGRFLALGSSLEEAYAKVGAVVEGAYTCRSAMELKTKLSISMPITECVFDMLYNHVAPIDAYRKLMQQEIQHEHL